MCAVISCPFWAGWLNKITAHTPAYIKKTIKNHPQITQINFGFNLRNLRMVFYFRLRVDEINRHRVRNNSPLEPLVQ